MKTRTGKTLKNRMKKVLGGATAVLSLFILLSFFSGLLTTTYALDESSTPETSSQPEAAPSEEESSGDPSTAEPAPETPPEESAAPEEIPESSSEAAESAPEEQAPETPEAEDEEEPEELEPEETTEEDLPEDALDLWELIRPASAQAKAEDAAAREPAHRKYVTPKPDGSYALSLEVTGDRQETNYPADVVVIFDVSLSTSAEMLASFKQAARTLADTLLTEENAALPAEKQTRMAIVTFATTAKLHGDFTADRAQFEQSIGTIGYHDKEVLTNWKVSLELANTLLEQAAAQRPDTRKYSLFLTDGGPNDKTPNYYGYVETENRATQMLLNGTTLYTLGVVEKNNEGSVFMPYVNLNALEGAGFKKTDYVGDPQDGYALATEALAIRAYRFAGRAAEAEGKYFIIHKEADQDYVDSFNQIAKEISDRIDYTDVTITDTLSEYASLLNEVGPTGSLLGATAEKISGETSEAIDDYTVLYDEASKTLTFTIAGALEHEAAYRLTFDIAPSQKAFDELAASRHEETNAEQNGYPATGGTDTGDSSEDQAGFFSNTVATLTFHTVDKQGNVGPEETATPFEKPVIQLALGTIQVQKEWQKDQPADRPASVAVQLLRDGTEYRTATLDAESGWAATFENLPGGPDGHTYTLEEIDAGENYEASYTPGSAEFKDLSAQSATLTITNTRTANLFSFTKTDAQGQALPGAAFDLYRWDGAEAPNGAQAYVDAENTGPGQWVQMNTQPLTSGGDGTVQLVFPGQGWYQLVETSPPAGFWAPEVQWRFTISADLALESIATLPRDETVKQLVDFEKTSTAGVDVWRLPNYPEAELSFLKISSEYYSEGQTSAVALDGAQFALYFWAGEGMPEATRPVTEEDVQQGLWQPAGTAASQNGGRVSFTIPAKEGWVYQLVETQAPENYQLPTGQWRVTFTPQGEIDTAAIQRIPGSDGANPPPLQMMPDGKFAGELALVNVPQYELPAMGGGGTAAFVWAGAALLLAGALTGLWLAARKRKRRIQRLVQNLPARRNQPYKRRRQLPKAGGSDTKQLYKRRTP